MTATIRYGLPGTELDAYIAEYLAESRNHPDCAWMILPVDHLAETVKQDMAARNISFTTTSHITTISTFAKTVVTDAYPSVHILSPVEQGPIFSHIVENNPGMRRRLSPKTDTGDKSVGFASVESLVTLYNTLRIRNAVLPQGNDRFAVLESVFSAYEVFCDTKQIADRPAVLRRAAEAIRGGRFPLQSVYLYGIFSPKKREVELLDAIRATADRLSEFAPYVANDKIFLPHEGISPAGNSAGAFAESVFQRLSVSPDLPIKKIGVFPDRTAEFSAIAEEICCLVENGVQPGDIAVLTPEVSLYVELAEELFPDFSVNGQSLEFTSSIGHPLFHSRSIASVFSLLETSLGNYTTLETTKHFSYHSLLDQLSRDGRSSLEFITSLRRILAELGYQQGHLDKRLPPEDAAAIFSLLETSLGNYTALEMISLLDQLDRENRSPSEFVTSLRRILAELGYQQDHLDKRLPPEDAAAIKSLFSVLADIDAAETLVQLKHISFDRFYAMLSAFVRSARLPPATKNPRNSVKILGFHEIVHQKIPYVFLAGLTADVLPRLQHRLPFLTLVETLEAGIQIYEETLGEERYAFLSAVLAGEKSVYLSAPSSDEETTKTPSVWLQKMMQMFPNAGWNCDELSHSASLFFAKGKWEEGLGRPSPLDRFDVERRIGIEKDERAGPPKSVYDAVFSYTPLQKKFEDQYSAERCFAVTDLERYAACPFRWYTELHLQLRSHPDPESDERLKLGNVIHKTMFRLIKESKNFLPSKDTRDDTVSHLIKIADEEFSKTSFATPRWQSLCNRYIGTPSRRGRLSEVIDHEIELAENGSFTPKEWLEYPISIVEIPGLPDGSKLLLEGRIDRVRLSKKTYIVTDYKTGRAEQKTAEIKSGKSLQLPLYLAAMGQLHPDWARGGGTYYRIAPNAVEETDPLNSDADCFVSVALQHAAKYRANMQQGICKPVYDKKSCEHCRERFICRVDRMRSLAGGNL
ncbi:MAG TPA: PD-(D/E)XK nuclease family protein [Methanocorpusculum sp.]|nr:PD-(D/E)XK nuclease family protein [Methanocorpusculum sp.]